MNADSTFESQQRMANLLKEARKNNHLTQLQLCNRFNVLTGLSITPCTIGRYENNNVAIPYDYIPYFNIIFNINLQNEIMDKNDAELKIELLDKINLLKSRQMYLIIELVDEFLNTPK